MSPFKRRFVIGKLTDEEFLALKSGETVIAKMLLTDQDYEVFRYSSGDEIQVETYDGNRLWASIIEMEIIRDGDQVIIIFTLSRSEAMN